MCRLFKVNVIWNAAFSTLSGIDARAFIFDARCGISSVSNASLSCAQLSCPRGCSLCTHRSCNLLLRVWSCERRPVPDRCMIYLIWKMLSCTLCSSRFEPRIFPLSSCFIFSYPQDDTLDLRLWTKNLPSSTHCSHKSGILNFPDVSFSGLVAQHKGRLFYLCPYRHACTFYSSTCTWQHVLRPVRLRLQFYRHQLLLFPRRAHHLLPWYFHTTIFHHLILTYLRQRRQKTKRHVSDLLSCAPHHQWHRLHPGRRFAGSYALQWRLARTPCS